MAHTRYVCIHGHFYQPPRENPWLETIEREESAYPYHNWNERILAECYRPNAASRIVDADGRIVLIANNYEKISFNFGPTLLSWLDKEAPDEYAAIIEADRRSQARFSGHGSAMAQAYNHLIMPLANRRDKYTQVVWGIRDFEQRFGRSPEGMWLPETAVDGETLDIMAELGIQFTVLAPGQARSIKPINGDGQAADVTGGRIDPGRTYRFTAPSGRHIDIFFYDGVISKAVAFERLLIDGRTFGERLITARSGPEPALSHIATDGETYGHHHRHGDMALGYALHHISSNGAARLTNYGEFRELFPAAYEVEIFDHTAWSCAHGVGRWSDDCGCNAGSNSTWHQHWRKPLRDALDWLRDELAALFEERAADLLADPWAARNDYIDVILDRSAGNVDRFLRRHAAVQLSSDDESKALQLLEMQRHTMLMYTSCGWFFDDIGGPEAIQILGYAARAIELAGLIWQNDVESGFLEHLELAESNLAEVGNGRRVYLERVIPGRIDLRRVIAHYAVSSLFDDIREQTSIYCYQMQARDLHIHQAGKAKLTVGTVRCTSLITRAERALSFGALHFGDHNLTGGVRNFAGDEAYHSMVGDVLSAFDRADMVATQRELDRHFLELSFSLKSLFHDHQERILHRILDIPLADAEAAYGQLYAHNAPLMRFLESFELPIPEAFLTAARFILQLRLRRALEQEDLDLKKMRAYLDQAKRVGVEIEDPGMDYLWQRGLERMVDRFASQPDDLDLLYRLTHVAEFCTTQQLNIDPWHTQNTCYKLLQSMLEAKRREAYDGNPDSEHWLTLFERLCHAMEIAT
ncbi:MAG: DUF3536 domain-containing protein [Proteobacteria bacterium]|nr:DUF3536 domain-containing protein [Pseudomonadota bacterium]